VIAGDDELMRVLNRVEHPPEPNVLFAGVQFIMMRDGGADLECHYPNFAPDAPVEGVAGPFREFVLANEEELAEIGRTRYTQTNECRRCVALLPCIWMTDLDRFHLIDLGSSAGLNLLVDRYHYRWGDLTWGREGSAVSLATECKGSAPRPREIEILSRTGIDRHPLNASDPGDRDWLLALIWPEHHERRERLRAALAMAATADIDLVAGDASALLAPTLDGLPPGEAAVVMHSFVLNQFHPSARGQVDQILEDSRSHRRVHRVSMEALDAHESAAALSIDVGDGLREVGRAQPHGEWLELYALP